MFNRMLFMPRICWAADDPAGDPPPTDPPAGDPLASDPPPADPLAGDPPAASNWWEGEALTDDQRQTVTAAGLTVDDPVAAVAKLADMEKAAQQKLGAKPGDLLTKPKDGQDVAEWLRENGEMLGIPEAADKYEIAKPDSWPKDIPWDDVAEGKAREIGHKFGVSQDAVNAFVALDVESKLGLLQGADDELAAANTQMMTALEADWGDQTPAKLAQARQAMGVVAEAAGMDQEAQINMIEAIAKKGGDANTWKFMSQLAEMMGEDSLAGNLQGVKSMGSTPAEARAELARLRSPEGEYSKAVAAGDRAEMARLKPVIERLTKLTTAK